jgi:hypothetical protein
MQLDSPLHHAVGNQILPLHGAARSYDRSQLGPSGKKTEVKKISRCSPFKFRPFLTVH